MHRLGYVSELVSKIKCIIKVITGTARKFGRSDDNERWISMGRNGEKKFVMFSYKERTIK